MKARHLILAILIAACSDTYAGQRDHYPHQDNYYPDHQTYDGWSFGLNVGTIDINSDVANRPDIQLDTSATIYGFSADYFSGDTDMTYGLGLSYISYNDNNPFSYKHDGYYESSDAHAYMAYIEAGPKMRLGRNGMTFVNVRGGFSSILSSERTDDCGCYSEDLRLKGGLYGVIGIGQSLGSVDLSLNFQQYFTGDFDNSLSLKIATTF